MDPERFFKVNGEYFDLIDWYNEKQFPDKRLYPIVYFTNKDNSTCTQQSQATYGESSLKPKYLNNGNYVWTDTPLYTYYKPKDVYVCCYLSETYGQLYADGYGLNFYTHEYGYYEYCIPPTDPATLLTGESGGATGGILAATAVVFILLGVYCYFKQNEGKEGGEESEDEPAQNIVYNINNTTVNQSNLQMTNYQMGGGMTPGPPAGMMAQSSYHHQSSSTTTSMMAQGGASSYHHQSQSTTSTTQMMMGTGGIMMPQMPPQVTPMINTLPEPA